MTYYQSANDSVISHSRALLELINHGISLEEVKEFYRELGIKKAYQAQAVLEFLGY